MRKVQYIVSVLLLVQALVLSSCAPAAPAPTQAPSAPASTEKPIEPSASAGKVIRIAALLPGRIDDMSFNQQIYEGLMRLKEKMGNQVDVTYTEGVYQVVDIEPALRDYAEQGYDLIIGHGFQFQDPVVAVAPSYPDVHFALGPGTYMTAANVSTYDADNPQVGYLLGTVAGLVTKTNKLGSIGGIDVPNIHAMHEGFRLAVEAANPAVTVTNLYTGDFRDSEATREAALLMIDQGADVIYCSGDGMVVGGLEAAKDRNVLFLTTSDMTALAPDNVVASLTTDWSVSLEEMVKDIQAKTFGGKGYALTLQNKGLNLVVYLKDKTAGIQEKIDATVKGLTEGTITIPEIK